MLRNDKMLTNQTTLHQLVKYSTDFHNSTKLDALQLCNTASNGQTG